MKSLSRPVFALIFSVAFVVSSCSKKNNPNPTPPQPTNKITSLSISQGAYNTSVVITGVGFSTTAADEHVFFNGKEATITAATTTQLTATVPLSAGTGAVTVKIKDGSTLTGPVFTYQLSWIVSTFAGGNTAGHADGTGTAASFNNPGDLAVDSKGNIYVADNTNCLIRKITPDGVVTTFAGSGTPGTADGTGTAASFKYPSGICVGKDDNIYVGDTQNQLIRKITQAGVVTTLAGNGTFGDTNGLGAAASFNDPFSLTVDGSGNLFVSDLVNSAIREVLPSGLVSTFAGSTNGATGFVNAQGLSARFNFPLGITIDATGNLYLLDNFVVRKITTDATVTTFSGTGTSAVVDGASTVASFKNPIDITMDNTGNLYITDSGFIRKVDPTGVVSAFAGNGAETSVDGPALSASFALAGAITIDGSGNFYVTDGNLIRKISMQ